MITKEKLEEEADAVFRFIYGEHFDEWHEFCRERRKDLGNQSLEHTTTLIRSLTQPQPWRYLVSQKEIDALKAIGDLILAFMEKIKAKNEAGHEA